jgi:hypothetical protein
MRGRERKKLLEMINAYVDHISCTENESLLSRIYGVYTFKTNNFDPMEVIIMENTIRASRESSRITFDLKGSLDGRFTKLQSDASWRESMNVGKVLKDNNYLEMNAKMDLALLSLDDQ